MAKHLTKSMKICHQCRTLRLFWQDYPDAQNKKRKKKEKSMEINADVCGWIASVTTEESVQTKLI